MNKYEYYIYIVYVKLIYTSFLLFRYIIAPNGQNVTKELITVVGKQLNIFSFQLVISLIVS